LKEPKTNRFRLPSPNRVGPGKSSGYEKNTFPATRLSHAGANSLLIPTSARVRLALKAFCTIGILWLIGAQFDITIAISQIVGIERYQLCVALIVLFLLSLAGAVRWSNVLKIIGYPLKFVMLWPIMLVASFFNQALPSTLGGDIVRMAHGYREGIPGEIAFSNVIIDRLASFASLLMLVAMSLPISLGVMGKTSQWWMPPFVVLAGIMGLVVLILLKNIPHQFKNIWLVRNTIVFSENLSAVLTNQKWGWRVIVAGFVVHVLRVIAIWLLAKGLIIEVSLLACLALVPLVLLVAMIPISIGGWGVREGAFLGAFSLVGVAPGDAVALSATFGLCTIFVSLPGGLIWLCNREIRESANANWFCKKEEKGG
jgi:uncharacterized protein (TIRG00374 family)